MEQPIVKVAGEIPPFARPAGDSMLVLRFNNLPAIQLLDGNRFLVSSPDGDIRLPDHGLYRDDTRFLSKFRVTINGKTPELLSSNYSTHYSAEFYSTNPDFPVQQPKRGQATQQELEGKIIPKESLAIVRQRFLETYLQEDYNVINVSGDRISFTLSFEVDADFLDLFEVKQKAFGNKPDMLKSKLSQTEETRKIARTYLEQENALVFNWTDAGTGFVATTAVWFSERGKVNRNTMSYDLTLDPKGNFELTIGVRPFLRGEEPTRRMTRQEILQHRLQNYRQKIEKSIAAWRLRVPKLDTNWDVLRHAYYQSLSGLLSLQLTDPTGKAPWTLLAAGTPWFMTLFGRDTLITAYQTLLFGQDLAKGTIEALSYYQADKLDENRDAEPGKIVHELRYGPYAARTKRFPYYGTIDATPLYLILISEVYRWTKDEEFVNRFKPNIMNALNWIDKYGDMDGDGFVEYLKKSPDGLISQSWKDSWNSMQFSDGRIAEAPIATCEVQGYVYDSKMRMAEIAKEVWKDDSLAKKLLDEGNELKELFNEKYWIEDRGYYALALDKNKDPVDAMTSNNGHLFWSGMVPNERVKPVVENLLGADMFSGYGVRTLSRRDKGYSPIGYHNGTIWPHDNSIIAKGLASYGLQNEARKIIEGMLEAIPHFDFLYPEVFSGSAREFTAFPVKYPTSCYPQAWAAGAVQLFLRTLLGLSPSRSKQTMEVNPIMEGKGVSLRLEGVQAFNKGFTIVVSEEAKPSVYENE